MMFRLADILEQVFEFLLSVGINADILGIKQRRRLVPVQKRNQFFAGAGHNGTMVLQPFQLRAMDYTFVGFSRDQTLPPIVLPEEKIENQSDAGST